MRSSRRLLVALLALAAAPARAEPVALTFDDLPALTILPDQPYVDYINAALLAGLRRHHLTATGFVNAGKVDDLVRARQLADLDLWLKAGFDLGNHTYSHESPNALGVKAYVEDIVRGEADLKPLLAMHHKKLVWFRHPFLETGHPGEVRREIDRWLEEHHYRVAPVTIDADDWEFAEPYDDAISRRDEARRQRIRLDYLSHTERMVERAQVAARALFGRPIAHVFLLHATRLNADCIDELAAILKRRGLKAASLGKVLSDPAYRTRDPWVGKDGIGWLERWAMELHKTLPPETFADPPKWIEEEYDRIDADRPVAKK